MEVRQVFPTEPTLYSWKGVVPSGQKIPSSTIVNKLQLDGSLSSNCRMKIAAGRRKKQLLLYWQVDQDEVRLILGDAASD